MTLSCGTAGTGPDCKVQLGTSLEQDSHGRRIYIHEDSFTDLASHGREEALLVYRMAARTVALKAVHHLHQDAAMLGTTTSACADQLLKTITEAWSDNTSISLKRIAYRPHGPRLRTNLYALLHDSEHIVASCYFSNYYTFATSAGTAAKMFDDTNDIATVRRMLEETDEYRDLSLINGQCLVRIDPNDGIGEGKATPYFQRLRSATRLSAGELAQVKQEVYVETKEQLTLMLANSAQSPSSDTTSIGSSVFTAIDYAFSKGILKTTAAPSKN